MKSVTFNDNWTVRHLEEEGDGIPVTIPDDAMLREPRTADAVGGLNVSWFEGRDYLYAKTFHLTKEQAEAHNVLEFEGVYRKAEVFLNGKKAGFRPYGYTNFYIECDGFLKEGENRVEVIARNAFAAKIAAIFAKIVGERCGYRCSVAATVDDQFLKLLIILYFLVKIVVQEVKLFQFLGVQMLTLQNLGSLAAAGCNR